MANNKAKGARAQSKAAREAKRNAERAALEARKKAQKLVKAQIKEMRPYLKSLREIDLRKGLSPSQKGRVTKAWKEYQALTVRPTKVYRTKNEKHLKEAQKLSQHSGKVKWDVAFVPSPDPKARVKFKDGRAILSTKYLDIDNIFFDLRNLVTNPQAEIERALATSPEANQFIVMAGEYLFNGGLDRNQVAPVVLRLIERYSPGGDGYEARGPNSYFAKWLFGLKAFYAKNQDDIRNFRREYARETERRKAEKKSGRRKRKALYGRKD